MRRLFALLVLLLLLAAVAIGAVAVRDLRRRYRSPLGARVSTSRSRAGCSGGGSARCSSPQGRRTGTAAARLPARTRRLAGLEPDRPVLRGLRALGRRAPVRAVRERRRSQLLARPRRRAVGLVRPARGDPGRAPAHRGRPAPGRDRRDLDGRLRRARPRAARARPLLRGRRPLGRDVRSAGPTPAGAFDDAADFARNDVIASAARRSLYRRAGLDRRRHGRSASARPTRLASELRADGARVTFHVWPGAHDGHYWHRTSAAT